jgi:hypothetical protein
VTATRPLPSPTSRSPESPMSTSPYLVTAYLGSAALYGGYLVHLVRRRRILSDAVAAREAMPTTPANASSGAR